MKKSLNEHIDRLIKISEYKIPETKRTLVEMSVPMIENQPVPPQQPQQQQNPEQQNNPQADQAFERELDTAMNQIMQTLPQEIQKLSTTQGDRDGQIEPIGQQNQQPAQQPVQQQQNPVAEAELNEAVGALVAGTALALPAIGNLVGKTISFLGKKADSDAIQSIGNKVTHAAEHLHHKYEAILDKILSPFTRNLQPETRKMVNKGVFYAIIACLGGAGAIGAAKAVTGGNIGLAAVESGLTGVKASELVAAVRAVLPRILGQVVA